MDNPYQPPTSEDVQPSTSSLSELTWFTAKQVGWSTFVGGPLAGAWLMAQNAQATGDSQRARWDLTLGVALSIAFVAVGFLAPDPLTRPLGIVAALTMYNWAKLRWLSQKEVGPLPQAASTRTACVVAVLSLLVMIVAFVGTYALVAPEELLGE